MAEQRNTSGSRRKQDVDALLADLTLDIEASNSDAGVSPKSRPSGPPRSTQPTVPTQDAQSLLDDLEGLVQQRRRSVTPMSRRESPGIHSPSPARQSGRVTPSVPPVSVNAPSAPEPRPEPRQAPPVAEVPPQATAQEPAAPETASGTDWSGQIGSFFSSASKFAGQARQEVERRAVAATQRLPSALGEGGAGPPANAEAAADGDSSLHQYTQRFAQGVLGFMRNSGLDKIGHDLGAVGRRGWNDILNVVAPPIAAHETVEVTLSHDMEGYAGVETLVFKLLTRVLQQVDIHDVTVHHAAVDGRTQPTHDETSAPLAQRLQVAENRTIAQSRSVDVLKRLLSTISVPEKPSTLGKDASGTPVELPESTCPILLRVQPFFGPVLDRTPTGAQDDWIYGKSGTATGPAGAEPRHLFFLVWWLDPMYRLAHQTCSQAIPRWWLDIPAEENAWVEQALCDVIEYALTTVAQDYVQSRTATFAQAASTVAEKAQTAATEPGSTKQA